MKNVAKKTTKAASNPTSETRMRARPAVETEPSTTSKTAGETTVKDAPTLPEGYDISYAAYEALGHVKDGLKHLDKLLIAHHEHFSCIYEPMPKGWTQLMMKLRDDLNCTHDHLAGKAAQPGLVRAGS